ncbi:MAG: TIR domain-containing protein [Bacteroidia bacterium]
MNKKKRVFLSYSYQDRDKVDLIVDKLINSGIEVYFDSNLTAKNSLNIKQNLKYIIEASETVLVVLSKNFLKSEWANYELSAFLIESHKRKVNVIPIIIEKSSIPSDLLDYEIINLSNNFEGGLEKIIKKLKVIPEISFDNLSPSQFQNLIADLLKEYDFNNIKFQQHSKEYGIDIEAEYESKSPFGTTRKEYWIVEVKFYKQERFSVNAIKQLIEYRRHLLPTDLKLLLVTNSILTSVVQDFLDNYQKIENIQIEVIDGVLLKQLISKRKRLLDKYFRA